MYVENVWDTSNFVFGRPQATENLILFQGCTSKYIRALQTAFNRVKHQTHQNI